MYMDTNQGDIDLARWIAQGQDVNAIHIIVFYDASTNCYFPVYVMPSESLEQKRSSYNRNAYNYVTDYQL